MSYIGNTPTSIAFLTDTFSGDGTTVGYTMTVAPANTSSIIVAVTGVLQDPSTYSVSGTTLTFSAAPPSGTSNISVRYLGIPASGVTTTAYRTVTNFTATAGQTSFSVPSYTVGYIDVYRNGVRLVNNGTDFVATTGTTVVLNNACTVGDSVVTESFLVSSVLNAIPATAGAVNSTYLASSLTLTTPDLGTPSALVATNLTGTANSLNAGIGVNQTWQSVTRAIGTTYTNSTGKPITVAITVTCSAGLTVQGLTINGVAVYASSTNVAGAASGFSLVIPNGATYVTLTNGGTLTLVTWVELR